MTLKELAKLLWTLDSYGDFNDYMVHFACCDNKMRGIEINMGQQTIMIF